MSFLAQFGPPMMSAFAPLLGTKLTLINRADHI